MVWFAKPRITERLRRFKSFTLREDSMEEYIEIIEEDDVVYSILEFFNLVDIGLFTKYDGNGYWSNGSKYSKNEVFNSPMPSNATHVVWFNK